MAFGPQDALVGYANHHQSVLRMTDGHHGVFLGKNLHCLPGKLHADQVLMRNDIRERLGDNPFVECLYIRSSLLQEPERRPHLLVWWDSTCGF